MNKFWAYFPPIFLICFYVGNALADANKLMEKEAAESKAAWEAKRKNVKAK